MSAIIKRQATSWISAIVLGLLMQAVFADKVYVSGSDGIDVIDTDSNSVINTIHDVGGSDNRQQTRTLAVNSTGTRLYVANALAAKLSVIDTKMDNILNDIPLSVGYSGNISSVVVNPSGTHVYVVDAVGNSISSNTSMIDTTLNKEVTTFKSLDHDRSYVKMLFNPSGLNFYTFDFYGDNISIFDAKTNSVTAIAPVNDGMYGYMGDVVVNSIGTRLYVSRSSYDFTSSIRVINTDSYQVINDIPAGYTLFERMIINPAGTRLYGCARDNLVVVNLIENRLETSIPIIDGTCSGMGINASGTRIYLSKKSYLFYGTHIFHTIDTDSNKVISTISLNPAYGETNIVVVSSAMVTPTPHATARISQLSSQAKLPIFGRFGVHGTGKLSLLFQGNTLGICVSPSMILQKYPSGEILASDSYYSSTALIDWLSFLPMINAHPSTGLDLLSNDPKGIALFWALPAGYYTVSLDALGCNEQGKLSIDIIEEDSSSSAKLINFSANAVLPITSSVTVKGTGSVQTMFRGFKVAPCVDANLELRNTPSGTPFASNDNWETDVNITEAKALPPYLQPIDSSDAGLLRQLTAQSITATLSSKNACKGDGVFGIDDIGVDDISF